MQETQRREAEAENVGAASRPFFMTETHFGMMFEIQILENHEL